MPSLGNSPAFTKRLGAGKRSADVAASTHWLSAEANRLILAGLSFWAIQLLVLCLEFGFSAFREGRSALCGLVIAVLSGACLAAASAEAPNRQIIIGFGVGLGLTSVQLISVGSFLATPWLMAPGVFTWGMAALLVGTLTGGALGWAETMLARGWGRVLVFLLAGSCFSLVHLAIVYGVPGTMMQGGGLITPVALVFVATLGFVTGLMLRDSGRLVSASSIVRRERFRVLTEAVPIPVVMTTSDHRSVLFSNRRSKRLFSLKQPPSIDGTKVAEPQAALSTAAFYVDPRANERLAELVGRDGEVENFEAEMRRPDGSTFWALISAQSVDFIGQSAIVAGYYDISDRKAAEEALLASEVRYALISRASNDGIFDWDIRSGAVYYSTRWKEIVGAEPGQPMHAIDDWFSRVHPEDIERLRHEIAEHHAGRTAQLDTEYRILHGEGRYCWMQCRALVLHSPSGEPMRMAGSQADITLRKTYEQNLLNAAYEDRLTGLWNRAYFGQHAEKYNTAASITHCAVILFNVDEFRRLNDNLGNSAGDALLIAIGRRLTERLRPGETLARMGGDEFALWIEDIPDADTGQDLAEMLLAALEKPFTLGDVEVPVKLSAGLASFTMGDPACGKDLLRNARLALDRSKLTGGGRLTLFDDALLRETQLRRRLSKDLINAERQNQITFAYQPIIKLDGKIGRRIAGFESLMRWQHPELGAISPVQFISIAEEAGLIGPLGLFAIEMAALEIAQWSKTRYLAPDFSVSVNLSARQISDRAGVLRLLALLDRLTFPRGRLKLEITESVLMSDPEAMVVILQEIRDRGVELCLDDFGTGYSSLSYLHRFPLDALKIDRSFVTRMSNAPEAYRLVRSIIELSHDLGLKVVAEGVETLNEVELLRGLNCDYGQGYFFSRPIPAADAENLLVEEAA